MAAPKRAPLVLVPPPEDMFRLEMPISLERFRGPFVGVTVVYDADRLMGLSPRRYEQLFGSYTVEADRLDAEEAKLTALTPPPPDLADRVGAIGDAHARNTDALLSALLSYLVIRVDAPPGMAVPDSDHPETWGRFSLLIRQYLTRRTNLETGIIGALTEVRENLEGEFRGGSDRHGALPG